MNIKALLFCSIVLGALSAGAVEHGHLSYQHIGVSDGYVTSYDDESLELAAGDFVIFSASSSSARINVTLPDESTLLYNGIQLGSTITQANYNSLPAQQKIVGPCSVTLGYQSYNNPSTVTVYVAYELTRASNATSSLPSNSVVIPTDATGNVEIILESSEDLVSWTAASPGTYGSSTKKRFFRVRAVAE